MAPEVAAVERKGGYNQSCDIWAVGITSIELAELQPPMFDLHPMRALFLMSKSGFKPPTLKNKALYTREFHDFVKVCLTKNPKKRPSAERLLYHPFVTQSNLTRALMRDLLEKARNPSHFSPFGPELDPDDPEGLLLDVPRRISSKQSVRSKQRPLSERRVDGMNFEVPHPNDRPTASVDPQQAPVQSNIAKPWGLNNHEPSNSGLPPHIHQQQPSQQQISHHQSRYNQISSSSSQHQNKWTEFSSSGSKSQYVFRGYHTVIVSPSLQ